MPAILLNLDRYNLELSDLPALGDRLVEVSASCNWAMRPATELTRPASLAESRTPRVPVRGIPIRSAKRRAFFSSMTTSRASLSSATARTAASPGSNPT